MEYRDRVSDQSETFQIFGVGRGNVNFDQRNKACFSLFCVLFLLGTLGEDSKFLEHFSCSLNFSRGYLK